MIRLLSIFSLDGGANSLTATRDKLLPKLLSGEMTTFLMEGGTNA